MPKKYIEAEKLKRHMALNPEEWHTPDERWLPERDIALYIDTCPEADVVEVVRCKDCEECDKDDLKKGYATVFCFHHGSYVPLRYFCGSGKRREK